MSVAAPTRPLVLPDPFDGSGEWEQWIIHFNNCSVVNSWNDEDKLKWLKVRLTGRAQAAFQRLTEANRATFTAASAALKERFEPATRKHRYLAELQTRRKKKGESWADLADDLKSLADKAYPGLQEEAREQLALHNYLAQLDQPQVAFGVKQKNPESLDAAVSATLELEAYVTPKPLPVMEVGVEGPAEETTVGAVHTSDKLVDVIKGLSERLDKLESKGASGDWQGRRNQLGSGFNQRSQEDRSVRRRDITCYRCGRKGHIARYCYSQSMPPLQQPPIPPPQHSQQQSQGNWGPPV